MGVFTEVHYFGLLVWRNLFPRGDFKAEDVPDLTGQVMIVTGALPFLLQIEQSFLTCRTPQAGMSG